jgi:hypothetical protein
MAFEEIILSLSSISDGSESASSLRESVKEDRKLRKLAGGTTAVVQAGRVGTEIAAHITEKHLEHFEHLEQIEKIEHAEHVLHGLEEAATVLTGAASGLSAITTGLTAKELYDVQKEVSNKTRKQELAEIKEKTEVALKDALVSV